jgi:hypothetical protein
MAVVADDRLRSIRSWTARCRKPELVESEFAKAVIAGTYPGMIISAAQRQAAWLYKSALAVAGNGGIDIARQRISRLCRKCGDRTA